MPETTESTALKEMFNAERYHGIARELAKLAPAFDRKRFLTLVLDGHGERALMARMRQAAIAVRAALPGSYPQQLAVLRALAPRVQHGFVAIFLPEFVTVAGMNDFKSSMAALRFFTRFGSAEFAIRPFLQRDQAGVLAVMERWATDEDEHVRRLASEGCRPRLPWGLRLANLVRDPSPLAPILEQLKDDPSLYVRKSVANNLNDIAKDHPAWVLARLESWDLSSTRTAWIARRAARTLVKRGDSRALRLFGVTAAIGLHAKLVISPRKLALGEIVRLEATIRSTASRAQRLVVDYVVHYVKSNGSASAKVFKWTELDLAAGASVSLRKRQVVRDFTTRRHFAGQHLVELQVNGQRLAANKFTLVLPPAR